MVWKKYSVLKIHIDIHIEREDYEEISLFISPIGVLYTF